MRLIRFDRIADQGKFERPAEAHEPRQEPRRAGVGHEADSPKASTNDALAAAIRKSQAKAQRGPGAGRDAVDRGDDRLGQRRGWRGRSGCICSSTSSGGASGARVGLAQVLAGTERPAGTGQDDDPSVPITSGRPQRAEQLDLRRDGQAVEDPGPSSVIVATPSAVSTRTAVIAGASAVVPVQPANGWSCPSTSSKRRRSIGSSA